MSLYLGSDDQPHVYEGGALLHNLILFGRLCKGLGMDITPQRMGEAAQALEYVGVNRKSDFYHTLRAILVTKQRDVDVFEHAFHAFWRVPDDLGEQVAIHAKGDQRQRKRQILPPLGSDADDEQSDGAPPLDPMTVVVVPIYSQQAALRYKDFAQMTGEELDAARAILARLPSSLGERRTRRYQSGKGRLIDHRRAFRHNMRYAGEPMEQPRRTRRQKPRPLVVLCDISGSMERYSRLLLHFVHTLVAHLYQVESFLYSTSLTHITHAVRHKSVDVALREVGQRVRDWGGGTRTGDALRTFNYQWSRRVLGRGAVVLLITDGWDRGEPQMLRIEIARLRRSCYRLIWLNPLLGRAEYEPLTRGAQAMLPYVDDFLPVHNLASLEMLVRELGRVDWKRK
jgi:uncharacterized protein